MANEKEVGATLSPELVAQLRAVREQMLGQYQAGRTGAGMPPEQSLALRSQISYITQIVEPGKQEMWPDYTSAEKQYLKEQSLEHARGVNYVAMAALGPFAAPAMVADTTGAPPEVVGNLIEIGFNATAVLGLGRQGARHSHVAEVVPPEPVEIASRHVRLVSSQPLDAMNRPPFIARFTNLAVHKSVPEITEVAPDSQAKNNGHYDARPVTDIKDLHHWRVAARKSYDEALKSGKEAKPILDWLEDPQVEKLGLALHRYGDGRGQFLADLRSLKQGADHSIDGLLEHYRTSPLGRSEAYEQVFEFERRLVMDIAGTDGELDPTKLRLVVARLNGGQYMTAQDYAALEYVRDLAHQDFVESKVETYRSMNKYMNLSEQALLKSIQEVRQQAEVSSPYVVKQEPHDHEPPNDHAPEL